MDDSLTDVQRNTLDGIAILRAEYGHPPTLTQMVAFLREPRSTVEHRLIRLRMRGFVAWTAHGTMRLTERGQRRVSKVTRL